jgi:membrane protein DedA with SNARE-associated domain
MADDLIGRFGYPGIVLLLVLGGLGVPIPEEAPIVLSAILSHKGRMIWWLALACCLSGVLLGDFVVYFLGYFYGEKVLSFRLTRSFLTRAREEQIKGYFHRHGIKILIVGRFAVGFRTAAYLTAGILRLPALRLLAADLLAASLSTFLMFAAGYWFADWIETGLREVKHYLVLIVGLALAGFIVYQYYKARKRAGRPVGPPILVEPDKVPLPPDDLHSGIARLKPPQEASPARPEAAPEPVTPEGEPARLETSPAPPPAPAPTPPPADACANMDGTLPDAPSGLETIGALGSVSYEPDRPMAQSRNRGIGE